MTAPLRCACLLVLAALPGCTFHLGWADCEVSEPRELGVDVAGVREVHLVASAGSLDVRGSDSARELRLDGTARASSLEALAEIDWKIVRAGDVLRVELHLAPDDESWSGCRAFDLRVDLPADLHVVIDDGSGDTTVTGVASLDVEDGSGELRVSHVRGDVTVDDGSGDASFEDIGGALTVHDGSGHLELARIDGAVRLQDGSGDVRGDELRGGVQVVADGSGSLVFSRVTGSVVVDADGSGDIRVDGVSGDFLVRADGSGALRHEGVGGEVRLPR